MGAETTLPFGHSAVRDAGLAETSRNKKWERSELDRIEWRNYDAPNIEKNAHLSPKG